MNNFYKGLIIKTLITVSMLNAQTLVLNDGSKLEGEISSLTKNGIIFKYRNNKEEFKNSEISAIYFKKEEAYHQSEISGNMTYFFNDNYGFKPDTGSEVYFVKSNLIKESIINDIKMFKQYSVKDAIAKYSGERDQNFLKATDNIAKNFSINISELKPIIVTVDGAGNFKTKLPTGKYIIMTKSAHRDKTNLLEISGMKSFKEVIVTKNKDLFLNIKCKVEYCSIK
ncbi:hypothetical protein [Poseidonibacter antarcticus]|uniref:hypothetical protein n=1 Tax=Poseidonibacter antarcticus TaxID=2478538 RepID=UPI0013CE566F|nr:hypothetical protein [Poseidonibacter antarcticus]